MKTFVLPFAMAVAGALALLFAGPARQQHDGTAETTRVQPMGGTATATFGGGCFWCLEAVFERIEGVRSVISGYAGGTVPNPTYRAVCSGGTGHAEVVQIQYDPAVVSYEKLLETFWVCHDPTTPNRQGADVGTQYRSVIFTHDEAQRLAAERSKAEAQKSFDEPIVTAIAPLEAFYAAEEYHQDYFAKNPTAAYCQFVIRPKLKKLKME